MERYYPMWMDIHALVFIGFGFLMCFLKTHSWSSIGFNYLVAAWAIQCCVLFEGFWRCVIVTGFDEKIDITIVSLIRAEFCAGACLITLGALLGKCTFPQMMLICTIESFFFTMNSTLLFDFWHVLDNGGCMTIHVFGCYFGLAASAFFKPLKAIRDKNNRIGGTHKSRLIAMIGTCFLFVFWPSFNCSLAYGMAQQRVALNTVFAVTASTLAGAYTSRVLNGKLEMEVVLNATLAGGIIIAAGCDIIVNPGLAMICGAISGVIAGIGFLRMNNFLKEGGMHLHDTRGVHFVHGVPGIFGAFIAIIAVACANYNFENDTQLHAMFP